MRALGAPGTDPISAALRSLKVASSIFCLSELRAPWGFEVQGAAIAKFHLVLRGAGWLTIPGHASVLLRAGDLALLPHGETHTLCDDPASPVTALDRLIAEHPLHDGNRLSCGGEGILTQILCGGFVLSGNHVHELLSALPIMLRVESRSAAAGAWLVPVLAALEAELADGRRGADAVQAKLADVFVTQALRSWLVAAEPAGLLPEGMLVQDDVIAAVVRAVRTDLPRTWTIDLLAADAGLSRTAFVTRFRRVTGDSPIRFVTRLRLGAAATLLTTTRHTLHEIATATGYDNEASLSKAFRRRFGLAPGAYRDTTRTPVVRPTP
jgi:AraC-like DNA-binding protein